ncbi:2413_t:CDS:2, partial [Dentiscutata erythropus]
PLKSHVRVFVMENTGIMDHMANGIEMEQNIVLPATVQAINSTIIIEIFGKSSCQRSFSTRFIFKPDRDKSLTAQELLRPTDIITRVRAFQESSRVRHTHTYSDTKDALKTRVRNVKENIKESAWDIVKGSGTGIVITAGLILFDFSLANWNNRRNERIILHAFEHGSCPEPD